MPTLRQTIFMFSCDICSAEFSSIDQEYAHKLAKVCEDIGTPLVHTFKKGIFTAEIKTPFEDWVECTFEILGLYFEKQTHRPMYFIQVIKSRTCYRESTIFDVHGEDIKQTIINKIVHFGCEDIEHDTSY